MCTLLFLSPKLQHKASKPMWKILKIWLSHPKPRCAHVHKFHKNQVQKSKENSKISCLETLLLNFVNSPPLSFSLQNPSQWPIKIPIFGENKCRLSRHETLKCSGSADVHTHVFDSLEPRKSPGVRVNKFNSGSSNLYHGVHMCTKSPRQRVLNSLFNLSHLVSTVDS